ncbi:MAG: Slp family lipoprotein [Thermodesulfobacteriota bacterium]
MNKAKTLAPLFGPACLLIAFLAGCAPAISQETRRQAAPDLTIQEMVRNPRLHRGKMVIFSGVIIEALNTATGTTLTVLEKPAEAGGRPRAADRSGGRFLAQDDRFLDPAIYAPGREVTVAGVFEDLTSLPLGEIKYDYPVIKVKELYLWRERPDFHFGFGFYRQF